MRNTYIVCYDICEPKRLRNVFKVMRGWGDQPSTLRFRMPVDASRSGDAPRGACGIIDHREDQVLFVDLGPAGARGDRVITALGKPYVVLDSPCIIV